MREASRDGTIAMRVLTPSLPAQRAELPNASLRWSHVMAGTSVAPYQYPPRHRRSPRHPQTLSFLTVMLTGVTLIALLALGSLFVAPRPLVAEHRPHDLVPRFYAGANEILAGG